MFISFHRLSLRKTQRNIEISTMVARIWRCWPRCGCRLQIVLTARAFRRGDVTDDCRIDHALPDHFEEGIRFLGKAFLFTPYYPHKKGPLNKSQHEVEKVSGPDVRINNALFLTGFEYLDNQADPSPLIKAPVGHPGLHGQGHEQDAAEFFMTFVVVKVQPKYLSELFLEVLNAVEMVLNAIGKVAHPDIDISKKEALFTAEMFVNGGKAHASPFGNITDTGFMEIRGGENFQDGSFEAPLHFRIEFV